jgi:hypothetical protein
MLKARGYRTPQRRRKKYRDIADTASPEKRKLRIKNNTVHPSSRPDMKRGTRGTAATAARSVVTRSITCPRKVRATSPRRICCGRAIALLMAGKAMTTALTK